MRRSVKDTCLLHLTSSYLLCFILQVTCRRLWEGPASREGRPLRPRPSVSGKQLPESRGTFLFASTHWGCARNHVCVCFSHTWILSRCLPSCQHSICSIDGRKKRSLLAHGASKPQVSICPEPWVPSLHVLWLIGGNIRKTLSPPPAAFFNLQVLGTHYLPPDKGWPPLKSTWPFQERSAKTVLRKEDERGAL